MGSDVGTGSVDSLAILDLLSGHMAQDAVLEDLKVWPPLRPRLPLFTLSSLTLISLPQEPGRFPSDGPIASLTFPRCKGKRLEEAKQVRHMLIQVKI